MVSVGKNNDAIRPNKTRLGEYSPIQQRLARAAPPLAWLAVSSRVGTKELGATSPYVEHLHSGVAPKTSRAHAYNYE